MSAFCATCPATSFLQIMSLGDVKQQTIISCPETSVLDTRVDIPGCKYVTVHTEESREDMFFSCSDNLLFVAVICNHACASLLLQYCASAMVEQGCKCTDKPQCKIKGQNSPTGNSIARDLFRLRRRRRRRQHDGDSVIRRFLRLPGSGAPSSRVE